MLKNSVRQKLVFAAIAATLVLVVGSSYAVAGCGCDACCVTCCAPPPVATTLCVKDPCTGCCYAVDVCLPAACGDEAPCVTWRKGAFGRKIVTYRWKCCEHCIDVVITRRGTVRVRG